MHALWLSCEFVHICWQVESFSLINIITFPWSEDAKWRRLIALYGGPSLRKVFKTTQILPEVPTKTLVVLGLIIRTNQVIPWPAFIFQAQILLTLCSRGEFFQMVHAQIMTVYCSMLPTLYHHIWDTCLHADANHAHIYSDYVIPLVLDGIFLDINEELLTGIYKAMQLPSRSTFRVLIAFYSLFSRHKKGSWYKLVLLEKCSHRIQVFSALPTDIVLRSPSVRSSLNGDKLHTILGANSCLCDPLRCSLLVQKMSLSVCVKQM